MSSQVRLKLLPSVRCLFDEPVQVKVARLRSRQVVNLRAKSKDERGVVFKSSAIYRADYKGVVDLNRDPSLGGDYIGVEPMGLLWSLRADTTHRYFEKGMSLKPLVVKFSVHEREEGEGKVLAEAVNERFLLGDGVSRLRVKVGNLEGVMFTPPGSGPFPAVLDLCSFISEKRASLLANKGFVVLAVDVFTHKPDSFKEIHLDCYKEAIDFLLGQPKVGGKGIGITSRSKASDIALSLAAFLPTVKACVWINGASANMLVPLYYEKRRILSPMQFNSNKVIQTASGAYMSKYAYANQLGEGNEGSLIPIEQAKGHFLFVASEDDRFWDSKAHMDQMVQRLKHHGKNNFESVSYPRAGHMLEPPYGPFCLSCPNGFFPYQSLWGGETRAHATAEVHLWKTIQEFLRTSLSFVDTNKSQVNK